MALPVNDLLTTQLQYIPSNPERSSISTAIKILKRARTEDPTELPVNKKLRVLSPEEYFQEATRLFNNARYLLQNFDSKSFAEKKCQEALALPFQDIILRATILSFQANLYCNEFITTKSIENLKKAINANLDLLKLAVPAGLQLQTHWNLSQVFYLRYKHCSSIDDFDQIIHHLNQALQIQQNENHLPYKKHLVIVKMVVEALDFRNKQGDVEKAIKVIEDVILDYQFPKQIMDLLSKQATLYLKRDREDDLNLAIDCYREILNVAVEAGYPEQENLATTMIACLVAAKQRKTPPAA